MSVGRVVRLVPHLALALSVAVAACSARSPTPPMRAMDTDPLDAVLPHSVTLSVADLEGTAAWYRDRLGFREVQRKTYPEFGTSLVFLEKAGYRVELIRDGAARHGTRRPDPPGHTGTFGVSQFAFRTANLAGVRRILGERGVAITWEFENAELGVRFLFVRDPEGNLIQFLQPLR